MIFIVNYYQYKVRCNKAIPVSGHWDDTVIKEPVSATFMTPFW
ncbi:hypothetical protein [Wolbachia endosymbiont (group A) of Bibio marci]|nr:hypothetical protein [Wolbachia endosymbiont (group A) of Bibio marci]